MILKPALICRTFSFLGPGHPAEFWPRYPLSSLLEGYQCVRHDEHISYGNLGDSVPPFGMAFSSGNLISMSHNFQMQAVAIHPTN